MEVRVRIERLGIELISDRGVFRRDVAITHYFADHSAVLLFGVPVRFVLKPAIAIFHSFKIRIYVR